MGYILGDASFLPEVYVNLYRYPTIGDTSDITIIKVVILASYSHLVLQGATEVDKLKTGITGTNIVRHSSGVACTICHISL